MGLAAIDPHSHEVQTKFYKIPKFGVNRPNSKLDTARLDSKIAHLCACFITGCWTRLKASQESTDSERPGKRQEGRHERGCLKRSSRLVDKLTRWLMVSY